MLSLSWSPSYCAIEGADANRQQCGAEPAHGFVVHGLWPQNESGWPEFCPLDEADRFVPDDLGRDYLDIMPSMGLIGHQWRKHGSCSGLDQRGYLEATRAAWEAMAIPEMATGRVDPAEVEAAFVAANDGLPEDGIAIACADGHVTEARICMTTDLAFRACPEVDARACRASSLSMPAPR